MIYMKHPEKGNAHFQDANQKELEAQGWVRWPHNEDGWPMLPTKEVKEAKTLVLKRKG